MIYCHPLHFAALLYLQEELDRVHHRRDEVVYGFLKHPFGYNEEMSFPLARPQLMEAASKIMEAEIRYLLEMPDWVEATSLVDTSAIARELVAPLFDE